jgi:signal transduction histidine kinase
MSRGWKLAWTISGRALLFMWLPVLAVTVAHFGTPMEHEWLHDVLRRLYYIPIIVGAFLFGLRGAMLTSLVVTVLYLPHAFWMTGPHAHHHGMMHADPTGTANKILELVLYNVVALVTGLAGREESSAPAAMSNRRSSRCEAMEQQLVRAGRLQALGEMTAGLAHEIKNPLASLKASSAIIADEIPETSPRRKMVVILQKEIDRLAALARAVSRFRAARQVDPGDGQFVPCGGAGGGPGQAAGGCAARGTPHVDMQAPGPTIQGDPDKLAQILLNVLLNAVQFTPEFGGQVEVQGRERTLPHGRFAVVGILDQGPGIQGVRPGTHLRSFLFHARARDRAWTLHRQPSD